MTRLSDQERIWRTVPEKDVIAGVLHYIGLRGGFGWRQNVGGSTFRNKGSDKVFYVQFGEKGQSDIVGVFPCSLCEPGSTDCTGLVFFIECKTELGKQSEEQIAWQAEIERHGGRYLLVRPSTYTDVIDAALGVLA